MNKRVSDWTSFDPHDRFKLRLDSISESGLISCRRLTGQEYGGTLVILPVTLASVMLRRMWEIEQLEGLDSSDGTPESICTSVAKIFNVGETEVACDEGVDQDGRCDS